MVRYYNVNGELVKVDQASLKMNDLGLIRGYGAFDFFVVEKGRLCFIEDYLNRFFGSASLLGLDIPYSKGEFKALIENLVIENGHPNAGIRLLLTGGYSPDGYTPLHPNVVIMQHPYPSISAEKYENGVKLIKHLYQREMPKIKTTNYLMGIFLRKKLKTAGAFEPLYHNGQEVSECVRSNFFIVNEDNVLVTPAANILEGITRKHLLQVAPQVVDVEIRSLPLEEVATAKEAFMTSSTKGVLPVVKIDDQLIGNGKPGAISKELSQAFLAHKAEMIRQQPSLF